MKSPEASWSASVGSGDGICVNTPQGIPPSPPHHGPSALCRWGVGGRRGRGAAGQLGASPPVPTAQAVAPEAGLARVAAASRAAAGGSATAATGRRPGPFPGTGGHPPPGRVLSQVLRGTPPPAGSFPRYWGAPSPPPAGLPKLGPHLDISELGAPSCPVEESVPLRKHSLDSDLAAGRVLSPVLPCHSAWEQGSVTAQLPLNASPRWVWVPGCPLPHLPHSEHSSPDHRSELF